MNTTIETGDIYSISARLMIGDALAPTDFDTLAVMGFLEAGKPVPPDWRVLSGNSRMSVVAIVCLRYEAAEVTI